MTLWHTVVLGAVAGLTIYFGLPVARLKQRTSSAQSLVTSLALGVVVFLVWDILSKAFEPIDGSLKQSMKSGSWGPFLVLALMLAVGLIVGLVGLVMFHETTVRRTPGTTPLPTQLALLIATGLGLHNFSEGLAIGQAAATGAIGFTLILVIGFGLHNVTEGFAIAAPLSASPVAPSWTFLGLAGLIGGGPTFLGTLIGYQVTSLQAFVLFLALAAGALLYVIGEMFAAGRRMQQPVWSAWGIVIGFLVAYGTDLILTMGGV